jgi:hypothetical protein
MRLGLVLLAQLAPLAQVGRIDTTSGSYQTPALRALVASAAAATQVPNGLAGYRATLESDIAVLQTDVQGREHATQLEQITSELSWSRAGALEQHVVGYRARGGLTLSALSVMRRPWVLPTLFGDRLRLLIGSAALEGGGGRTGTVAIHPLAADRDAVYQFTGGDTAAVLAAGNRRITLVRVHVTPRDDPPTRLLVFRGDLFLDADRRQIVHLRGELLTVVRRSPLRHARETILRRHVFIDVVDGEFGERYWLPTIQRVDVQLRSRLSEGFRPGFRIVTRFRDHVLDSGAVVAVRSDSGAGARGQLTFASHDSLDAFVGWQGEIGASVTGVAASDFDDVLRPPMGGDRRARVTWRSDQLSDVLRYDKIEGLYTGAAVVLGPLGPLGPISTPDSTTAVTMHARVGWAWAEHAVRGSAAVRVPRGPWQYGLEARHDVVNTSDFLPPLEGPATISAFFASIDDYDYVGRTAVELGAARAFDAAATRLLRLTVGPGRDERVRNHAARGLVRLDSTFRPNRPVATGSYVREAISLSINPRVSGEYLEPGVGLGLSYERGDGGLRWQRADVALTARHNVGRVTYFARAVAAAVFGGSPPQQLIEFGENEGMPGFGYKAFGGDRAALGRLGASYRLPYLTEPLRLRRWLTLPGPTPALSVALQGGWADAVAPATRAALAAVGTTTGIDGTATFRTMPTGHVRASATIAIDLFGGAIGLGVAHRLERGGDWRIVFGSQQ